MCRNADRVSDARRAHAASDQDRDVGVTHAVAVHRRDRRRKVRAPNESPSTVARVVLAAGAPPLSDALRRVRGIGVRLEIAADGDRGFIDARGAGIRALPSELA